MANRYMKRCSASLVTRKLQIKPTVRDDLTSVRMAVIIRQEVSSSKEAENGQPLCAVDGNVNWCNH